MNKMQDDNFHYRFRKYVHKRRWLSIWHQLDEVLAMSPEKVLELGPGPGLFKALAGHFGINVETVDLDPKLEPDYVASATKLPMESDSYDCVCAFQMLEHLPYDRSLQAFGEMVRVTKNHIVISLPDAKKILACWFYLTNLGRKTIHLPMPRLRQLEHEFDGEHYWEINKKGYPLQKIINDFTSERQVRMRITYRVDEQPYHRFFVFEKIKKKL